MDDRVTPPNPFVHLRQQCCQGCQALQSQWGVISRNAQQGVQQGQRAMHDFMQGSLQQLQALSVATQRPGGVAAFASMSLGASRTSKRNVLLDLAYSMTSMQERVAGIPVYTVANKRNELVLVAGEYQGEKKQLGLFFFSEQDAQELMEQVREQNPELGKDSHIQQVGMDAVYAMADKGNKELSFRFMPDAQQVRHAMQIMHNSGLDVAGFTGVPIFQAAGLTVKTKDSRRTPLFLDKNDLDAALGNAYSQRVTQRDQATRAKVDRAHQDLADATKQVSEAADDSSRAKAEAETDKAQARIDKYNGRLADAKNSPQLQIEVGSLEEVLTKMAKDKEGSWDDVMFVPPGAANMMKEADASRQ